MTMSAYTSLIHQGLKRRYDIANSTWSSTPQDKISPYDLVLARISLLCGNRAYFDSQGNLWSEGRVWPGTNLQRPATYAQGVNFGVPTIQYWSGGMIDEDDYLDPGAWYNKDYHLEDLRAGGLHPAVVDGLWSAYQIVQGLRQRLEWIPAEAYNTWQKCITAGGVPYFLNSRKLAASAGGGQTPWPDWLKDHPERQYAWDKICQLFEPLAQDYKAVGWNIFHAEAERIRNDVRFWEAVSKYSGIDALVRTWDSFKAKIRDFNANQQVASSSIAEAERLLVTTPGAFTLEQQQQLQALKQEVAANTTGAKDSVGGQILNALMEEGQQIAGGVGALGIHPIVYAVGVAVLATSAAAFATWVVASEVTKQKAVNTLRDFITKRDDFDNRQFDEQMSVIEQQERTLMAAQGSMDPDSWQQRWDALQAQRELVASNLLKQRQQTQEASDELAQNLKKQTEGGLNQLFGDTKVMVVFGALAVGAVVFGPKLMGKKGKS